MSRIAQYRYISLNATENDKFVYVLTDEILRKCHRLDQLGGGIIKGKKELANEKFRRDFLYGSIIEEAVRSSQLEGAVTTRRQAKEMILKETQPENHSQRMVLNNFYAMQEIRSFKDEKLSKEMICELQGMLTKGTLDDEKDSGRFRTTDDVFVVDNRVNEILHIPPKAVTLNEHIEELCSFINENEEVFIHPVVMGIILHFIIGYLHPFADGNGRTARALFYWYCLKKDYWLMEYISISKILKDEKNKYVKSYMYTETDDYDMTYFIHYQLNVIERAFDLMMDYISSKQEEGQELEKILKERNLHGLFNQRQIAPLWNALENPAYQYTIDEHKNYHMVTHQTARTDLLQLANKYKLFSKLKHGRKFVFIPMPDIVERLQRM